ncbi:hypothetical protein AVI53_02540 [Piscirickettsia salmonis]|nr:hypothetical protein [Piscirickettsia salmonis]ALT18428.1 hypothetical protein PSLF89_05995 [Piscirickettsia salmonis LF-89 = ATCC VR-1361]ALY02847.1 hypothetical protein AWE47_08270 [Piscirickettsia salmonis]AMA42402.1 hypothetical protein AWJ11_08485 [Piscirickettsia salmonis]AOS34872.1 hypothetical protein AVM72_05625 [Piscirickettsia salmonis]APS59581.1 hypothetical protein AVI53_02540 [Piscirickettsia salmonis]
MKVSRSAFYAWDKRPAKVISIEELQLYRRCKELFKESRGSLGSRMMAYKLQEEGFQVGRYRKRRYLGRYFAHPMMQNRRAKRDDYKPSAVRVTQRYVP